MNGTPDGDPNIAFRRAVALLQAGDAARAIKLLRPLLRRHPGDVNILNALGMAKLQRGNAAEGVALLEQSLQKTPDQPSALSNIGVGLRALKQYDEALAALDRAIALAPDFAQAHNNRGLVFRELARQEEAFACFNRAVALKPEYFEALSNRGNTLKDLNRPREACASFERAIALDPGHPGAKWNLALAKLMTGDFAGGLPLYEMRWQVPPLDRKVRHFKQPLWLGDEPVEGKTLLIYAEQGFGDIIQFCRYAPMALAQGARVVFEAPETLLPLLATLPGEYSFVAAGDPLPGFDMQCPVMSLPLAFKTTLDTIPAEIPYLAADPARVGAWRNRLGPKTKPRIGLVWSGRPRHPGVPYRSVALHRLAPLLALPFEFHAVQKDIRPEDAAMLAEFPRLHMHCDELNDFADTAALIAEMDLVISIDTSVVHVAGALGKPVWILLLWVAEWRWLMDRTDSPWYPTATLFRQQAADDWASVIGEVSTRLQSDFDMVRDEQSV
jgi:tetratricopeptide (TPR) repeat protein